MEKRIIKEIVFLTALISLAFVLNVQKPQREIVHATVMGPSMYPTLKDGDNVTYSMVTQEEINIGDIVVYQDPRGMLNVHRVIYLEDGYYMFKGDNNNMPDQWALRFEDIKGKVV